MGFKRVTDVGDHAAHNHTQSSSHHSPAIWGGGQALQPLYDYLSLMQTREKLGEARVCNPSMTISLMQTRESIILLCTPHTDCLFICWFI